MSHVCLLGTVKLAFHDADTDTDTDRPREEIACVGRKIVAVFGESVLVLSLIHI